MHAFFFYILTVTFSFALELGPESFHGSCKEIESEFKVFPKCLNTINDNTCSVESSCISPRLSQVSGRTFNQQGPNCFSTALFGAGLHDSFRGVSAKEFQATLSSNCEKITQPRIGDIGVYYTEGFGPTHAYTYVSKSIAFEKQGVDYAGQTPLRFNTLSSIDYTHRASKECRQYGDESCHAKSAFYRCSKIELSQKFSNLLNKVNLQITKLLDLKQIPVLKLNTLKAHQLRLNSIATSPLEKAIAQSILIQIQFL